jgi:type II secretory pathway pseudopilin PulG
MGIAKRKFKIDQTRSRGFSILDLMIVITILGILTTLALMVFARARSSFRVQDAVGTLQSYLEKAISDSKRRNAKGDARARIRVLSTTAYEVKIDFDGDGVVETRTITLPSQTSFQYDVASPPQATVDWRGYVAEPNVSFVVVASDGQTSQVRLTGIGDVFSNAFLPVLPTVSATPISSDVKPSASLIGNATPNPYASPTPTPTPLPVCIGSQLPATTPCTCPAGKKIDLSGKCK